MKLLISFITLLLLTANTFPGEKYKIVKVDKRVAYTAQYGNTQITVMPDISGNILVHDITGYDLKLTPQPPPDSFINFPGYPIEIACGWSWLLEGTIFCNMDADSDMEIVTLVGGSVYVYDHDGTILPGWPQPLNRSTKTAPAFGDIDGDGNGEVVVKDIDPSHVEKAKLYAFRKNGETVPGFPLDIGFAMNSPVLADLNADGALEIFIHDDYTNEIFVYRGDGSLYPGWPRPLTRPASAAAVGDVTGDGIPEIFMEGWGGLMGWDRDGNELPGFPYTITEPEGCSYSAPVLADLDFDGKREIIFCTHTVSEENPYGFVHIVRSDGEGYPNWPKKTNFWIYAPVSIGYIDDDNVLDIAVGDWVISPGEYCHVYAWNSNGQELPGFPAAAQFGINAQTMMADIDNDGRLELIADDNTWNQFGIGKYHGYNHDGTIAQGWPVLTNGCTFYKPPCITDVNRDGILDLVGASQRSSNTTLYLWNTEMPYNPALVKIPIYQYNERHNGVWDDITIIGINPVSGEVPKEFMLFQNYPNPFNPVTKIRFSIPRNEHVTIAVYDVMGREIATIAEGNMNAGTYETDFNAASISSGVYFYKLITTSHSETKKMILIK